MGYGWGTRVRGRGRESEGGVGAATTVRSRATVARDMGQTGTHRSGGERETRSKTTREQCSSGARGTPRAGQQRGQTARRRGIASRIGQQNAAHSAVPAAPPHNQGGDGGEGGRGRPGGNPPSGGPAATTKVSLPGRRSGGGGAARVGQNEAGPATRRAAQRTKDQ